MTTKQRPIQYVALTQTVMHVVAMSRPRSARTRTEGQPVYKQHNQHATPIYKLFFRRFKVLTETNIKNVTPCRLVDMYIYIKPHVLTCNKKAIFPIPVHFGYNRKCIHCFGVIHRSVKGTPCDGIIQDDSFGTTPKKMRISQRLFIRF